MSDITNADIDAMGEDELMEDVKPPEPEDKTADNPPVEKQDSEKADEKVPEGKEEEPAEEEKVNFDSLSPDEKVNILQERITELQSGYTKEHLSKLEMERKIKELDLQKKQEELKDFEKLSTDELQELKDIDTEAATRYEKERLEYEQKQEALNTEQLDYVRQEQDKEISAFIEDQFGIKIDPELPIDQQPEDVKKIDTEIGKVADYLVQKHRKLGGNGKFYTRDQFVDAHKVVNFQEIMAREKAKGADVAVSAIERAKRGGSNFDKFSSSGGKQGVKRASDFTAAEIDGMGYDELDSLVD